MPFLGRIPHLPAHLPRRRRREPLVIAEPDSPAARAFFWAAEQLAAQVSIASYRKTAIPVTEVG